MRIAVAPLFWQSACGARATHLQGSALAEHSVKKVAAHREGRQKANTIDASVSTVPRVTDIPVTTVTSSLQVYAQPETFAEHST
ncbi:hypothetical protein TNCV_4461451 [Trichonephila clavipes]|nr:hypothetical protein TNCV_4461451 [Trichonephila clavipes]